MVTVLQLTLPFSIHCQFLRQFFTLVISRMALIREWMGGGMVGMDGQVKGRPSLPLGHRQWCCALSRQQIYTNHRIDQDSHWQQFGTQPNLISAPQWENRPCNAPIQFYRVGKKLSVKADLAIYSHAVDVCGQCMSESLILGHNLDFSSCDMVRFCKSRYICIVKILCGGAK